jgi:uncharacterized repeat protein (TIGR03803 family)
MNFMRSVEIAYSQELVENEWERHNGFGQRVFAAMLFTAAVAFGFFLGEDDAKAQTTVFFQTLYSFKGGIDGATPYAGLVLSNNTLYGTATGAGADSNGTVFAVNVDGTDFRVLHTFAEWAGRTNLDGAEPYGGLVLSSNTLYGTTFEGGTADFGTVFALNTNGTGFTTVHNFTEADGGGTYAGLIMQGSTLYGTTQVGGDPKYLGNVFTVNTDGTGFTSLYNFSDGDDGGRPFAGLLLSGNTLYGTASEGGTGDFGTLFGVNTNGTDFTVLYSFTNGLDGSIPYGGLVQSGNRLYGTAAYGGTNGYGTVFGVNTNGIGFTVLHTFNGVDGSDPSATLVLSGNTLYGTTAGNTVFAMNTDGTDFKVLHSFQGPDGETPWGNLVLSGKTLYGTTFNGGSNNYGTVFTITLASVSAIDANSIVVSGGQLQFVVTGLTSNATVYVQASSDLSSTNYWAPIATNVTTATNLTISGLSVTNASHRFFRVLEAPPP